MDDKKNKKYVIPEAEVINFVNEDIITLSGDELLGIIGTGDNEEDY